ncbi:MAG: phosphatidate cytidylyltransferase [Candidatus Accumulibacter sp.]|jgi:phosphatidate cytidylyltransferase|nr:phosphatidate cytidylyltransferase [Accumulibacter sp.]
MLKTRVLTAICLLAGLLGALFFLPENAWVVFCALICAGGAWEWGGLAKWGGKARVAYAIALAALVLMFALDFSSRVFPGGVFCALAAVFWLLIAPFWLRCKWPLRAWSAALTGIVVLVPPALVFFILRTIGGPWLLLGFAAIVWVADSAAYFSGRALGGRKLAPSISPGKTWAGALGGTLGVVAYCNVIYWTTMVPVEATATLAHIFAAQILFVGLAALSIVGDLFESLLKRQAGVKDSGHLLPGHGGILDRIDSLTSTLPFVHLAIAVSVFY